jgi:hypothetical protein
MLIASSFIAFVAEWSHFCLALPYAVISSWVTTTKLGHSRILAIHGSPSLWQFQSTLARPHSFIIPDKALATSIALVGTRNGGKTDGLVTIYTTDMAVVTHASLVLALVLVVPHHLPPLWLDSARHGEINNI